MSRAPFAPFADEFVHIGCDEVDFNALNSTASIVAYMQRKGIPRTGRGFKKLIAGYVERLCGIVVKNGKTPIAWQEAMDHCTRSILSFPRPLPSPSSFRRRCRWCHRRLVILLLPLPPPSRLCSQLINLTV